MATVLVSFLDLGKLSGQGPTRPTRPAGVEAELTRGGAHRSGDPAPGLSAGSRRPHVLPGPGPRPEPPAPRPPRIPAAPLPGRGRGQTTRRARAGPQGPQPRKEREPLLRSGPGQRWERAPGKSVPACAGRVLSRGVSRVAPGQLPGGEPGVAAARSAGWSSLGGNFKPGNFKPEFKTRKLVQALELDCRVSWATSSRPRRGGQTQGEALQRFALLESLKKLGRNCGPRRPVVGHVMQLVRGVCPPHPQHTPSTPYTQSGLQVLLSGSSDSPRSDRQHSSRFSSKFIFTSCLSCELRREGVFHRLATP